MSSTAAECRICEIPRDLTIKQRPKIELARSPSTQLCIKVIDYLIDIFPLISRLIVRDMNPQDFKRFFRSQKVEGSFAVADPDLKLRGRPGLDLLALLALFPSVIFFFFHSK